MSNKERTFLVSDTHFGHKNICVFKDDVTGKKLRPWDDVEMMNEDMIVMWNQTVNPEDKVYHLGDAVMNRKWLPIFHRLNGRKILIKGNHDIAPALDLLEYFDDIRACHIMNNCILTHIPIHPSQFYRFGVNIHGHLHADRILDKFGKIDPRYYNVCVENTEFKPILIEEVFARIRAQGGEIDSKRQGNR